MSERNVWLFAAISYGILAVSSISLFVSRLVRVRDADALLAIRAINAVLTPMLFLVALVRLLICGDSGDAAEPETCPEE